MILSQSLCSWDLILIHKNKQSWSKKQAKRKMSESTEEDWEKNLDVEFDDGSKNEYKDYFWFVDPQDWGHYKWHDMMSTVSQMPPNASRRLKLWYKRYIVSNIVTVPCPKCKKHGINYLKDHPIRLDYEAKDALSLFTWLYNMREFINDRKGKALDKRVPLVRACKAYKVVGSVGFIPVASVKKLEEESANIQKHQQQQAIVIAQPLPPPVVQPPPIYQRAIVQRTIVNTPVSKPSYFGRVATPNQVSKIVINVQSRNQQQQPQRIAKTVTKAPPVNNNVQRAIVVNQPRNTPVSKRPSKTVVVVIPKVAPAKKVVASQAVTQKDRIASLLNIMNRSQKVVPASVGNEPKKRAITTVSNQLSRTRRQT